MSTLSINNRYHDRRMIEHLKTLERQGRDASPVFKDMGEYLLMSTDERFTQQRGPDGRAWAPLKPDTKWQRIGGNKAHTKKGRLTKKAQGKLQSLKILTRSHRLRRSIVYRVSSTQLEWGSNVVYAGIHQHGGRTSSTVIKPKRKRALFWPGAGNPVRRVNHPGSEVPARPYLGVSSVDARELLRISEKPLAV